MLVPEGLLMELGPAPGANWNFVLGHLQPVLGEHEPVSFLALSGAVLSLLKTIIGAGAELFGFSQGPLWLAAAQPQDRLKAQAENSLGVRSARRRSASQGRMSCLVRMLLSAECRIIPTLQ